MIGGVDHRVNPLLGDVTLDQIDLHSLKVPRISRAHPRWHLIPPATTRKSIRSSVLTVGRPTPRGWSARPSTGQPVTRRTHAAPNASAIPSSPDQWAPPHNPGDTYQVPDPFYAKDSEPALQLSADPSAPPRSVPGWSHPAGERFGPRRSRHRPRRWPTQRPRGRRHRPRPAGGTPGQVTRTIETTRLAGHRNGDRAGPDEVGRDGRLTPVNVDDRVEPGPGRNIGTRIRCRPLPFRVQGPVRPGADRPGPGRHRRSPGECDPGRWPG